MPIVSFRTAPFSLSPVAGSINAVYEALVQELPKQAFTSVTNEGDHAHCDAGGVSLSVTFLDISQNNFWRVIATAEDSNSANADAQIAKVASVIENLKFL